jgi:hypothetical protein
MSKKMWYVEVNERRSVPERLSRLKGVYGNSWFPRRFWYKTEANHLANIIRNEYGVEVTVTLR